MSNKTFSVEHGAFIDNEVDIHGATPLLKLTDTDTTNLQHTLSSSTGLVLSADANNVEASTTIDFSVDGSTVGSLGPTGNLTLTSATSPTLSLTDTTNTVTASVYAQDSNVFYGSKTNHSTIIGSNNTASITIDTSQNVNVAGSVTSDGLVVDGLSTLSSIDDATPLSIVRASATTDQAGISFNAGNNTRYIGKGTDDEPYWSTGANLTAGSKIVTSGNFTGILDSTYYQANDDISVGNITATGYLRGPATFTIDPETHGDNTGTVVIAGDLTVNGTTTTISSTNTLITDQLFELGNGRTGSASGDSGLIIERGDDSNAFIGFDESADQFVVATTTATGASTGDLTLTDANFRANQITTTYANNASGVMRNIYESTSAPTAGDGQVGDVWIVYA